MITDDTVKYVYSYKIIFSQSFPDIAYVLKISFIIGDLTLTVRCETAMIFPLFRFRSLCLSK